MPSAASQQRATKQRAPRQQVEGIGGYTAQPAGATMRQCGNAVPVKRCRSHATSTGARSGKNHDILPESLSDAALRGSVRRDGSPASRSHEAAAAPPFTGARQVLSRRVSVVSAGCRLVIQVLSVDGVTPPCLCAVTKQQPLYTDFSTSGPYNNKGAGVHPAAAWERHNPAF
jgi:hypothetical protein